MNQQAKNEIRIFKKFARACPYKIDLNSIVHKDPRKKEPDISCNLLDGHNIAFEIVQCLDPTIAQSTYKPQKLKKELDSEVEKLPDAEKERFKRIFKDAHISITFKPISTNKIKSSIPVILECLLTMGNVRDGKFNLSSHKNLKNVVDYISIKRVDSVRPMFEPRGPGFFFSDPCIECIQNKFEKKYKIKSRIDLLAYYELQYEFPKSYWLPSVQRFIEDNIGSSVFQRVWIYSVTKDKILFIYPPLEDTE